jgi:hypothetical protein
MCRSNNSHVGICLGACVLVSLLWNGAEKCQASEGDCSAVYDAALEQEQAGHLREANEIFQSCAVDGCSNPVRQTCQAKLFRLELDTPSVVPLVKDQADAPRVDVTVTMDGAVLASRLDGRAFTVDPGLHEFVFSADGETLGSTQLVIAQGERNRLVWLTLASAAVQPKAAEELPVARAKEFPAARVSTPAFAPRIARAPREHSSRGGSLAPYLLGGTALAGAAAYLVLSNWARTDNQHLDRCSPNCPQDSVSHIRTLYLVADLSLGVAAAAALSSAAWFLFSGSSASSSDTRPAPQRSYALTVQPERAGALATFRGSF